MCDGCEQTLHEFGPDYTHQHQEEAGTCRYCGKTLDGDFKFCPYCGRRI
jgi:DNA-directed RNA polymerase subunit RPC12/RpoP